MNKFHVEKKTCAKLESDYIHTELLISIYIATYTEFCFQNISNYR
jgi:hypothetical protein